jgi:glycosyltransferase involved in cell wall biosynthesis
MVFAYFGIMAEKISGKIKVLEMHSSLGYAGGQRNMVTFAKNLNKELFQVFIASYREGGSYELKLRELGIEFVVSQGLADPILKFIRDKEINIIHIHRSGGYVPLESEIIEGAKKINPQMIIVEKNVFGHHDRVSGKNIDCSMFQSMMHLNERYLPKCGCDFDFSRMKVLYNMADANDFEKYRLSGEEIKNYKKSLDINEDDFVVGKIARAHVAKWSDLVLDMMPYLIKLVPKIKFIMIGVPPSRVRLIQKSNFKNNIIILPETSDEGEVHKFYQTIDVLAHSSKIGECNGNTINEAMFWRKPVITNSTPRKDNGQLEQVIHMENGIIANYPQTFARALAYLYSNPDKRKDMGDKGFGQVTTVNKPENITLQLGKVLIEKLLKGGLLDDVALKTRYDNVGYYPSENDIVNYNEEYKKRLTWDFGTLSAGEKVVNFLNKPKKFYWKIRDFAEHKLRDIFGK